MIFAYHRCGSVWEEAARKRSYLYPRIRLGRSRGTKRPKNSNFKIQKQQYLLLLIIIVIISNGKLIVIRLPYLYLYQIFETATARIIIMIIVISFNRPTRQIITTKVNLSYFSNFQNSCNNNNDNDDHNNRVPAAPKIDPKTVPVHLTCNQS